jgi:ribonucleoside-diphosphate reductase beta chain
LILLLEKTTFARPPTMEGDNIERKLATQRFVLFPIQHQRAWERYKDQEASFWTAEEMDLSEDVKHYRERLTYEEREALKRVLAFFAGADTIVAENIDMNFIGECEKRGWLETVICYQYQVMMENIHSEA